MPRNTDVNEDECRKLEETKGLKEATLLKRKKCTYQPEDICRRLSKP